MADMPSDNAIRRMKIFVEKYTEKPGTYVSPIEG